jgi:GNAT superfamily N-acetyltransferase
MKIRPALFDDVPQLIILGKEFYRESQVFLQDIIFDPAHLATNLRRAMRSTSSEVLVLVDDEGWLHGAASFDTTGNFFSPETKTAVERFYYIAADKRGRYGRMLLAALEEKARVHSCTHMVMVSLEGAHLERAGRLYAHEGYSPSEHYWVKILPTGSPANGV